MARQIILIWWSIRPVVKADEAGDYLYTVFPTFQARQGAWGIFRVGQSNVPPQTNAACAPIPSMTTAPALVVVPRAQKDDGLGRFIRQPVNRGSKTLVKIDFSW